MVLLEVILIAIWLIHSVPFRINLSSDELLRGTARATDTIVKVQKLLCTPVTITKYNPVESQCDSDPTITADNSKIDLNLLNSYKIRWMAVSRDLLDILSMGDTVSVVSPNQRINGNWVVHDVMNKRYSNRIDLLVPENDNYQFHSPLKGRIEFYED